MAKPDLSVVEGDPYYAEECGTHYKMYFYGVLDVLERFDIHFSHPYVDVLIEEAFEDAYKEGYIDGGANRGGENSD